jgi:hypothetical protein
MLIGRVSNPIKKNATNGKTFWTFKLKVALYDSQNKRDNEVDKYCVLWPFVNDRRDREMTEGAYVLMTGELLSGVMKKPDGGTYVVERIKVDKIMSIARNFSKDEEEILETKKEDEIPF